MLNYLRDRSRLIRIPRSYSDLYLKIRKLQKKHPNITDTRVAELLGVTVKKVHNVLEAFSMKFSGSAEYCQADIDSPELDNSDDLLCYLGKDYHNIIYNIANLPEQDERFLNDYLIKKRSHKTIMKNYPQLKSLDDIKAYSNQLIDKILNE